MNNFELLDKFYSSFKHGDANLMNDCYHPNVEFKDPAFGILKEGKPSLMWEMLLSNKEAAPKISFKILEADVHSGKAEWKAEYFFGPQKRRVINNVKSEFIFNDGKIIKHTDTFDIWKWSKQALGPLGYLLGWTPLMKVIVQKMANKNLDKYMNSTVSASQNK